MSGPPCKDCADRHPHCHSHCEKYLDFTKKRKVDVYAKYGKSEAEYFMIHRTVKRKAYQAKNKPIWR